MTTHELLEQPSLAKAAVAGVAGSEEAEDLSVPAEPSDAELAIARELVRSARPWVAMTGAGAAGTPATAPDPTRVRKRQRRLGGVDTILLSLVATGLTNAAVFV
jgi:hypothetical protein